MTKLCPCDTLTTAFCNACYYGEALNQGDAHEPTTDEIFLSLFPPKPLSDKEIIDSLISQGVIKTPYRVCVDATKSTLKQDVVMLFNLALAAAFVPISKLTKREMRL